MSTEITVKSKTHELSHISDNNHFQDLNQVIDSDIVEIDSMYTLIRNDLVDKLTDSGTVDRQQSMRLGSRQPNKKVSPVFLTQQTANLNSIKSTKLQFLKEKARLREAQLDREIRIYNAVKKDIDGDDDKVTNKDVLNYLIKEAAVNISFGSHKKDDIIDGEYSDIELEAILNKEDGTPDNEMMDSEIEFSAETNDENVDIVIDGDNYRIVFIMEENILAIVSKEDEIIRYMDESEVDIEFEGDGDELVIDRITNSIVEIM